MQGIMSSLGCLCQEIRLQVVAGHAAFLLGISSMDYLAQEGKTTPIMKADPSASVEVFALYGTYSESVAYHQVEDLTAWAQQFMDEANAILAKGAQAE